MRTTSIDAYKAIESEGLLTKERWLVYQHLFHKGPKTAHEIDSDMNSPDAHKRLSELRDQGAISEVFQGSCPITGRRAIFWDVTDKVPEPYVRPLSKAQRLEREVKQLRQENAELRARLNFRKKTGD